MNRRSLFSQILAGIGVLVAGKAKAVAKPNTPLFKGELSNYLKPIQITYEGPEGNGYFVAGRLGDDFHAHAVTNVVNGVKRTQEEMRQEAMAMVCHCLRKRSFEAT